MFRPAPWLALHRSLGLEPPPAFDDRPLAGHLALHAAHRPEAVAIQFHDRGIGYGELFTQGLRLATALRALGVAKGDVVGLHLPNVPQYLVAVTALSRLGAVGTGVSPLLAPGEIAFQLKDAGVKVLLTLDALAAAVLPRITDMPACLHTVIATGAGESLGLPCGPAPELPGLRTMRYPDLVGAAKADCPQTPVTGDDTFMIQYTGGTTGRPKGAMLSIRNLMYNPQQTEAYAGWSGGYDEVLMSAFPLFHIAGLSVHVAALRYGCRTLLIPDPRDMDFICRQLQRFPPTRIAAVPTLYQMLVNTPAFREVDFSRLKIALSGAAPLPLEDRRRIEAIIGANRLSDVFGMTETGPVHVCNPPMRCKPTAVGIPVAATDTRIVDLETGTREMPFNEPGEIIASGPQVMKGYLNLPGESARALRVLDGRTWMFTGDVGYMDEEGYVHVCDRAKDMLIVGGYKVFSVEIEDKLKALDCIAQSAVIGTPDTARPGNDVVNLYVELTPGARTRDEEAVRAEILAFCRENMAPYKVPKHLILIEQIPVTAVGKIDKKALRVT
ncbi:MAG: AMP-binding protein [Gammaproteobacteria bacterium]|nr:AMP-binding protein [Gammaproteobacteria bacterium]